VTSTHTLTQEIFIITFKSRILPVVLYECETLSLTIREEQGVVENIWTEER
jgi:hypothetical protein